MVAILDSYNAGLITFHASRITFHASRITFHASRIRGNLMGLKIGVLAAEHIAAGAVENHAIVGTIRSFTDKSDKDYLAEMPTEEIVQRIVEEIQVVRDGQAVECIGVGFPGIIREGIIEESPNLSQLKGQNFGVLLAALLAQAEINA